MVTFIDPTEVSPLIVPDQIAVYVAFRKPIPVRSMVIDEVVAAHATAEYRRRLEIHVMELVEGIAVPLKGPLAEFSSEISKVATFTESAGSKRPSRGDTDMVSC